MLVWRKDDDGDDDDGTYSCFELNSSGARTS